MKNQKWSPRIARLLLLLVSLLAAAEAAKSQVAPGKSCPGGISTAVLSGSWGTCNDIDCCGGPPIAACGSWMARAATIPASLLNPASSISFALNYRPVQQVGKCTRAELRPVSGWLSSGAFRTPSELLVVDARSRKLLSYRDDGTGFEPMPFSKALEEQSPVRISAQGTRLLVEMKGTRLAVFDHQYLLVGPPNYLRAKRFRQGARIDKLSLWGVAGTEIVAYADVIEPGPVPNLWRSGFIRFSAIGPTDLQFLAIPQAEPAEIFYRIGYPFITSLDDTAFILLVNSEARVLRNSKGSAELEAMNALDDLYPPSRWNTLLPVFERAEDFPALMRAVERSSMPAGIYGWRDYLYVLSRAPNGNGTRWTLSKIDPRADRLVSTVTLPAQANHLTVVPGPEKWAFIEKGPVRGYLDQEARSILWVPSAQIESVKRGNVCQ